MDESLHRTAGSDSESFRRAIRWLSQRREERTDMSVAELVSEASRQFDLSPLEEASLLALLTAERSRP